MIKVAVLAAHPDQYIVESESNELGAVLGIFHQGFVAPQQRMSHQVRYEMVIRSLSPVRDVIQMFYIDGLVYFLVP